MKIEDLIEKYKKGETTLAEEQILFKKAEGELSAWATYVQKSSKKAPEDLDESIWSRINKHTRIVRIGIFSAAASILFLLVLLLIQPKSEELSRAEKEKRLDEAYAMLHLEKPSQNIIYEDELIIIYTETENNN